MKIRKVIKTVLKIFLISFTALFCSCDWFFHKDIEEEYTISGSFVIDTIPDYYKDSAEGSARSAFPTALNASDYTFTIKATRTSDSKVSQGTISESGFSINLPAGEWAFTITAAKKSDGSSVPLAVSKIVYGQVTSFENKLTIAASVDSAYSSIQIFLGPVRDSGNGSIKLPVKVESYFASASVSISAPGIYEDTALVTFDDGNDVTYYIEFQDIPAASYTMKISFYNSLNDLLYYIVETVNVFSGLETNRWVKSGPSNHFTEEYGTLILCITASIAETFRKTTVFVDPEKGVDTNEGTYTKPVKTIQKAFDKHLSALSFYRNNRDLGDPYDPEYAIYLMKNITASDSDFSKSEIYAVFNHTDSGGPMKVLLSGFGSPYITVDLNRTESKPGRIISLEGVALTLQDIHLTGGYCVSDSDVGAGVTMCSAPLTLKGNASVYGNYVKKNGNVLPGNIFANGSIYFNNMQKPESGKRTGITSSSNPEEGSEPLKVAEFPSDFKGDPSEYCFSDEGYAITGKKRTYTNQVEGEGGEGGHVETYETYEVYLTPTKGGFSIQKNYENFIINLSSASVPRDNPSTEEKENDMKFTFSVNNEAVEAENLSVTIVETGTGETFSEKGASYTFNPGEIPGGRYTLYVTAEYNGVTYSNVFKFNYYSYQKFPAEWTEGIAGPFSISKAEELEKVKELNSSNENFRNITLFLEEDIDVTSKVSGFNMKNLVFDGNGHTITMGTEKDPSSQYLFGTVEDSVIKNLTYAGYYSDSLTKGDGPDQSNFIHSLKDSTVENCSCTQSIKISAISQASWGSSDPNLYFGFLAGVASGKCEIKNCTFKGKFTPPQYDSYISDLYLGTILGKSTADSITISGCQNYSSFSSPFLTGGIVGFVNRGKAYIEHCANKGIITSDKSTNKGGIAGYITDDSHVLITGCYNYGTVQGFNAGGIAGSIGSEVTIRNCFNEGQVEVISGSKEDKSATGGIVGIVVETGNAEIYSCTNNNVLTGEVTGGILGRVKGTAKILNCMNSNKASVTSNTYYAAGMVAHVANTGKVTIRGSSYNYGSIKAPYAAGFVAFTEGAADITNCTNSGLINEDKEGVSGGIIACANGTNADVSLYGVTNSNTVKGTYAGGIISVVENNAKAVITSSSGGSSTSVTGQGNVSYAGGFVASVRDSGELTVSKGNGEVGNFSSVSGTYAAGFVAAVESGSKLNITGGNNSGSVKAPYAAGFVAVAKGSVEISASDNQSGINTSFTYEGTVYAGGIIACATGSAASVSLKRVTNYNPVTGTYAGGIISVVENYAKADIRSSSGGDRASVTGKGDVSYAGGFVASVRDSGDLTVSGGLNTGSVSGTYAAGFVASVRDSGKLTVSGGQNKSSVSGTYAAGIVAAAENANQLNITGCKYFGTNPVTGTYAGGIAGYLNKTETEISSCSNLGTIFGTIHTGGIAGYVDATGTSVKIAKCINTGSLKISAATSTEEGKETAAGGIAGYLKDGDFKIISCRTDFLFKVSTDTCSFPLGGILGYVNTSTIDGTGIDNCSANTSVKKINASGNDVSGTVAFTALSGIVARLPETALNNNFKITYCAAAIVKDNISGSVMMARNTNVSSELNSVYFCKGKSDAEISYKTDSDVFPYTNNLETIMTNTKNSFTSHDSGLGTDSVGWTTNDGYLVLDLGF